MLRMLVINPGSTSTKLAVWAEAGGLIKETAIEHQTGQITRPILEQLPERKRCVEEFIQRLGYRLADFDAFAARGGLLRPLEGGTYTVNKAMVLDLQQAAQGEHPSNLAALIAYEFMQETGCPAFITDPVSVDEFIPLARYAGIPQIKRRSLSHALNIKATARKGAEALGKGLSHTQMVVAHLGGGISVTAVVGGQIIDVNNANEMGPYAPARTGGLPAGDLVRLAFSGRFTEQELKEKITRKGGLVAYLGTNNLLEVEKRIANGDERARLYLDGMIYQVSKEIGACSVVLKGNLDLIILTGGGARSRYIVDRITDRVEYLARIMVFPGSLEMEALARGAYRVLTRREKAKKY